MMDYEDGRLDKTADKAKPMREDSAKERAADRADAEAKAVSMPMDRHAKRAADRAEAKAVSMPMDRHAKARADMMKAMTRTAKAHMRSGSR